MARYHIDYKFILIVTILLAVSIGGCTRQAVQIYSGERRASTEVALLRGGERAFIQRINEVIIDDNHYRRNNYTDKSCAPGKWYELLPGQSEIEVTYAGFFTHYNPEYTYIIMDERDTASPFIRQSGSEIYLNMISSDTQILSVTLEAGKKYEIRAQLVDTYDRPFIRPKTPKLIAPNNPLLYIVKDLADRHAFIPAIREDQLTISDFAWEAYIVELGSEEGTDDQLPQNDPLAKALDARQTEFAEFLLKAGANVKRKSPSGFTPLHRAAQTGQYEPAWLLILKGVDPNAVTELGMTPLHLAAENGYYQIVDMLIEHGADVNAKNDMGATPLFYAAGDGHTKVVAILLDNGADIEAKQKNKWTPLHHATHGGHDKTVELLLARGAEINARTDIGLTPLCIAASEKHCSLVELLIAHGAQVHRCDRDGYTPLHYAAIEGDTCCIRNLIDAGALVDAPAKTGCTPLHLAAANGHYDAAAMLLASDADIYAQSNGGFTPLHMAAIDGNLNVGRLLLKAGANPGAKLDDGRSVYDVAVEKQHVIFARMIRDHMEMMSPGR